MGGSRVSEDEVAAQRAYARRVLRIADLVAFYRTGVQNIGRHRALAAMAKNLADRPAGELAEDLATAIAMLG